MKKRIVNRSARIASYVNKICFAIACTAGVQFLHVEPAFAAATTAGTQISNTVNATYGDASSTSYSTNSNTVVTVVQNAPTMVNTGSSAQTTVPGQTLTDSFTLTNTGNNGAGFPGEFQIDSGSSSVSLVGASVTGYTYTFNGVTSSSYSTIALLNTALASVSVTDSGATDFIVVNVTYTIPTSAAIGTFTDTLAATLTYPGGGSGGTAWAASTTADSTTAVTNTVATDARLDLQLSSTQTPVTGILNYTLKVNNGGSTGTKELASAQALIPGPSANGVVITEAIPQFGGTPLTLSSTVVISTAGAYGYDASSNYRVYYTTNANGSAGWTAAGAANGAGTVPAGATYFAVYVYGGASGIDFAADAANSTIASVTNAAMTIQFSVNPPTGTGSANAGSVPNVMNALWGDNQTTEHILGPAIPLLTTDTASATQLYTSTQGLNNASAPPGSGYLAGYSNATSDQALASSGVINGPCCTAASIAATGSYDGVVAANTDNDFTAMGFSQASFLSVNASSTAGSPNGNNSTAATTVSVQSAIKNTGNSTATITLLATAPTTPAGWTVILDSDNAGVPGAALTGATTGSTSTGTVSVGSNVITKYWAVYTAPSGTPALTRYDASVVATSGATSDTTHHELYNGYVALTLNSSITSNGCPAGLTPAASGICPGGILQYVLDYRNIVVGCASGTEASTTACSSVNPTAGSLSVVEDGTGSNAATSTNNWSTYTLGLVATPVEVSATGNGASTFTYTPGPTAPNAQAFTAVIGGAGGRLAPSTFGTITYSMTVK